MGRRQAQHHAWYQDNFVGTELNKGVEYAKVAGYSRTTGQMSMMIARNGPGVTNFVAPVKTAYWNHTPSCL